MRGPPWGVQGLFGMSIWPAFFLLAPFTPATATVFLRGVARPTATELEHLLRASLTTDVSGVAAGRVAEVNAHGSDPTLVAHQRRTARHTFGLATGNRSLDYVRVIGF